MPKLLTFISFALAAIIASPADAAPPEKKPLTREACAKLCQLGPKQKLAGPDKETFNACTDARLCTYQPTYQVEGNKPYWPSI